MKVLFVNNCLTGGGSERAMCLVANYVAGQGNDNSMILLVDKPRTYNVTCVNYYDWTLLALKMFASFTIICTLINCFVYKNNIYKLVRFLCRKN